MYLYGRHLCLRDRGVQLTLVGKCSPVWKASRPKSGGVNLTCR